MKFMNSFNDEKFIIFIFKLFIWAFDFYIANI